MKILILAGGLGTRLKGFLSDLPKPMAPVNEHPFIEYVLMNLKSQNYSEYIFSIGHRGEKIQEYFGNGNRFGLSIEYSVETDLLGTGGAIKLAEPFIDSADFIVINGDTYFEADVKKISDFHKTKDALVTLALVCNRDTGRYGRVILDVENRILSFVEKGNNDNVGYINGGLYIFKKELFEYIPSNRVCSLEREILPLLIGKGLYGFPADSYFIDIGIPEDYERAKKELPERRVL